MLWHVYAHAFVINVLRPGIRLISLADLVSTIEAWADEIEWERLEAEYPRLIRALAAIDGLVPWSARIREKLRVGASVPLGVRPISSSTAWQCALSKDVWWPPRWWFDVRYGIDGPAPRLWHRFAIHPASVAIVAGQTARRRLFKHTS